MALKELREERARLFEQCQAITDKAGKENRNLTSEEMTEFDKLHVAMEEKRATIERMEKVEDIGRDLAASAGRKTEPMAPSTAGAAPAASRALVYADENYARLEGMRTWLLAGSTELRNLTGEQIANAKRMGFDPQQRVIDIDLSLRPMRSLAERDTWTYRALGVGTTGAGGFTVPDEMMRPLEVALLQFGGMRQTSTVIRTDTGASLPIPMTNDTGNTGAIVVENTTVTQQDVAFTQLVLGAYKYSSKMILVSVELMQDNAINLASFLGEALGTRIGRITNTHFTTGTGTGQPFGLMTQATIGKQPATTQLTAVFVDDLIDLEHSVDPAYRPNARFMMNDSTLKTIKKLKDTQGRPLFLPGISSGAPDTILGYPFTINQDVASAATTTKTIAFGDLSKYIIRDVLGITLLRLDERFAEFHQTAFLAFARMDGNLMNAGTHPVKVFAQSA